MRSQLRLGAVLLLTTAGCCCALENEVQMIERFTCSDASVCFS